jgi:hypothetical protein
MQRGSAFVYEDFTKSRPSEEMRKRHREARNELMRRRFQKQVQQSELRRAKTEPYSRALSEFLSKNDAFKNLPSGKSSAARTEPQAARLAIPNVQRLRKRIFRTGSCITIDPPTPLDGFVGWTATEQTPGPGASAQASSDNTTGAVSCGASGGANYNIPGSATCWGYMGQYYSSPQNLPAGQFGLVQIQSSPTIKYQAVENITSFLGAGGGAGLTAQVSVWVPVYDANWNHLQDWNTAPVDIIQPDTINLDDPLDIWTPEYTYPLGLGIPLEGGQNIGVFVEFYAYAWGSGGSTGSWDFVGTASIQLSATVPSLMLEALEWVP